MPAGSAKRIGWVDIAKGIAMLLVIVGHTLAGGSRINHAIFSFHMPLFFLLAGYTFRPKPWGALLRSSVRRLLVPYALLFALWHVPLMLAYNPQLTTSLVFDYAMAFLFASGPEVEPFGFAGVGTSWFLAALFCGRILLNGVCHVAARTCGQSGKRALLTEGVLSAALLAAGVLVGGRLRVFLPMSLDLGMVAAFFMWCGCAARELDLESLLKSKLALVAAAAWAVCVKFSYLELADRSYRAPLLAVAAALLGSFCLCWVARVIERKGQGVGHLSWLERFLVFTGKNSMAVYCIHVLDWWLPWQSMPTLDAVAHPNAVAAVLRCAYDLAFVRLMALLSPRIDVKPRAV